ncbi:nitric oxide synthase oxygenase [Phenylobacterium sp.]|uniref:nitric oxide synthase oxygenase n=1 Tax=Phenylobacterium sp. TaxID=1871053 RepID=UPI0027320EF7|nr:nitric oxide synthase oxygenase [Phenylobacterium sp.]MDP1598985.1 nitric oxide synthase oxygenase [Phenylobacterium sp.]MDP3590413.1 nitric oxide synthase oxygenase [Phenylobacterium sp.]
MSAVLVDTRANSDPLRRRLRRLTLGERVEEARDFIDLFGREQGLPREQVRNRRAAVISQLRRQGWYEHTSEELAFGARVAWRNSAQCVGRIFWKSLEVIDCRAVTEPSAIAGELVSYLQQSHQEAPVRSKMLIFAPMRGDELSSYIENPQLIQYAGHLSADGAILGDLANVEFTRIVKSLGWSAPNPVGAFDVLPLVIRDPLGRRHLFELPPDCFREVPLTHPDRLQFNSLGLKWYAIPFVSDMILTIGGMDYPCSPFNGFYMATEIACRNLVDEFRYNLLERVAEALEIQRHRPLWQDETLTELSRAVLSSFRTAGISVCDHHEASEWFVTFAQSEQAAGRSLSAEWTWIVPPHGGAACPTFHMPMINRNTVPNFYRSRVTDGASLRVDRSVELETPIQRRWRSVRRRVRKWRLEHSR